MIDVLLTALAATILCVGIVATVAVCVVFVCLVVSAWKTARK